VFEWKPRGLVPVALANATAGLLRQFIIEPAGIFPATSHPAFLRSVANRMPEHRLTRASVVAPDNPGKFAGLISMRDLLHARAQNVKDERHLERILNLRLIS
jgi:hypothetical protein